MDKKPFDVSIEQLTHEFTMLKIQKKFNNNELETYGDLLKTYTDELDTMKTFLNDQFTK